MHLREYIILQYVDASRLTLTLISSKNYLSSCLSVSPTIPLLSPNLSLPSPQSLSLSLSQSLSPSHTHAHHLTARRGAYGRGLRAAPSSGWRRRPSSRRRSRGGRPTSSPSSGSQPPPHQSCL